MTEPLIIIDTPNMAHRSYHALKATGNVDPIAFGVLRSLRDLSEQFNSVRFAFAFDSDLSRRKEFYPEYKCRRGDDPEHRKIKDQIDCLRTKVLPELGYDKLWLLDGYEADDIIGYVIRSTRILNTEIIIVSNDSDLHQLLLSRVRIYNPSKKCMVTSQTLKEEYNLTPAQWIRFKAICGCDTDDVPGIPGVGPISAGRYLNGGLGLHSKYKSKIESVQGQEIIQRNIKLVQLPYQQIYRDFSGWPLCDGEGKPHPELWDMVVTKLKMPMLQNRCPGG